MIDMTITVVLVLVDIFFLGEEVGRTQHIKERDYNTQEKEPYYLLNDLD